MKKKFLTLPSKQLILDGFENWPKSERFSERFSNSRTKRRRSKMNTFLNSTQIGYTHEVYDFGQLKNAPSWIWQFLVTRTLKSILRIKDNLKTREIKDRVWVSGAQSGARVLWALRWARVNFKNERKYERRSEFSMSARWAALIKTFGKIKKNIELIRVFLRLLIVVFLN